jgi:hypothetical protein
VTFCTANSYKAAWLPFSSRGVALSCMIFGSGPFAEDSALPVAPVLIRQTTTRHRHNLRGLFILRTHPKSDNVIPLPPDKSNRRDFMMLSLSSACGTRGEVWHTFPRMSTRGMCRYSQRFVGFEL